ncbi:hypothetical protein NDU88_003593 [Pleurodeles waltl]|uniref:Uncharacterized protein n=1 Tax=Pleurodeles waltl TaxID=8319 RepID=A0AAV7KZF1_PLEWA|nr:hypothetical protein NDU88_003593 [Pleurodeles waltl]
MRARVSDALNRPQFPDVRLLTPLEEGNNVLPRCDGPQVHQADLSRQIGSIIAAPDPEAVMMASNPLPFPPNGGQGQEIHALRVHPKDVQRRTGGVGVSSRKEERRARPDDVSGTNDSAETRRTLEALPEESEAREVPCDNFGHAYGKTWPPQVCE